MSELDDLPLRLVLDTDEAERVCRNHDGWVRLRFLARRRNSKPALYGVSRALKDRGVDAIVRADGDGHVLIARLP